MSHLGSSKLPNFSEILSQTLPFWPVPLAEEEPGEQLLEGLPEFKAVPGCCLFFLLLF